MIGLGKIGGIDDLSIKEKKRVKYISSVQLRNNGLPIYQVITSPRIPHIMATQYTENEDTRKWVSSWKIATELDWSLIT